MSDAMPPLQSGASVWYEIPSTDLERSQAFYEKVLDISMIRDDNPEMPNPMVWFSDPKNPAPYGHLYPGTPAPSNTGNTIHMLASDKLEEVLERVEPAGGTVISPIVDIPAGRFAYITDPDGNSIGLFNFNT